MYVGSRLHDLCKQERGLGAKLSRAIFKKNKGIERYYRDGMDITVSSLEKIAIATGKSVEYFLDYQHPDGASPSTSQVYGSNNIVNSPHANEAIEKIEHLNQVIKLQEDIIKADRESMDAKDELIHSLKERINDYIKLMQEMGSDKTRT